ncbi:MAG: ATP synthase F1 subunit epsilon [Planctomycetota bacterium]|nr:ATP synthase F1 subunit epsilon [Planctomycetota bacterium]
MSDAKRMLTVSVVTPEGAAYEGAAAHVVAPAFDGEMAFYPTHAPLVGVLGFGELRVTRPDGEVEYFYLAGGVVQVADDEVSILAESVTPARKLDANVARKALDDALATPATGEVEIEARLRRADDARARLRVAARAAEHGHLTADQILSQPVQ